MAKHTVETVDQSDQSEYNTDTETQLSSEQTVGAWAKATVIRAVKTAAQSAVAAIPVSAATLGSVDWALVLGTAALAAVMSVLTSIAGVPEVSDGSSLKQIAGR
jgi:hypothetical protein